MSGILTASTPFAAAAAPSGYTLLAHNIYSPNGGSLTTSWTLDTTGADLIVILVGTFDPWMPTSSGVTDDAGNTYDPATLYGGGSGANGLRFFYKHSPATGSTVSFTTDAATALYVFYGVLVFSGSGASPLDQENGTTASGGGIDTAQPGSITPSVDNSLVVSGIFRYASGASPTVDSGMTYYGVGASGNIGMGGIGWVVQTAKTAINPTWTSVGVSGGDRTLNIASFKPA